MEEIQLIHLDETDSTNRYLSQYQCSEKKIMTVVTAEYQTAGRGQGSHTWESEKGQNLMFSIMLHPVNLPVARQFVMMQAEALAIFHILEKYAEGFSIKWPNDIYWHDRKISGTLSEAAISDNHVKSVILGTGINVNQERFSDSIPNPVSLCHIINRTADRMELLHRIILQLAIYINMVNHGEYDAINNEYIRHLYRNKGYHKYSDNNGEFTAMIQDIQPNGRITLYREDGRLSEYDFCEVHFII